MLDNEIDISFKEDSSRWAVDFRECEVKISDIGAAINVSGKWFQLDLSEKSGDCGKKVEDELGRSAETDGLRRLRGRVFRILYCHLR